MKTMFQPYGALGPNAPEFPGVDAADQIERVIEKPNGDKITIFASGCVVVCKYGNNPRTHRPNHRVVIFENGRLVESISPKLVPLNERCLNVASCGMEEIGRALSNFALRPFNLDGRLYASVESWYQGLKWPEAAKRNEIAGYSGPVAKRLGKGAPQDNNFFYEEIQYRFGSAEHHQLIKRAIKASLEQNQKIQTAFIKTHPRPIVHLTGRPEKSTTALSGSRFAIMLQEIREEFIAHQSPKNPGG